MSPNRIYCCEQSLFHQAATYTSDWGTSNVQLTASPILAFMFQYVIFGFQRHMIDLQVPWGSRTRHSDILRVTNRLQWHSSVSGCTKVNVHTSIISFTTDERTAYNATPQHPATKHHTQATPSYFNLRMGEGVNNQLHAPPLFNNVHQNVSTVEPCSEEPALAYSRRVKFKPSHPTPLRHVLILQSLPHPHT